MIYQIHWIIGCKYTGAVFSSNSHFYLLAFIFDEQFHRFSTSMCVCVWISSHLKNAHDTVDIQCLVLMMMATSERCANNSGTSQMHEY